MLNLNYQKTDLVIPKLFMKVSLPRIGFKQEPKSIYSIAFLKSIGKILLKLKKFVISDEGLPCVNTIEQVYLGLLVTVFALGILSLFRLSYFKAEIRKVFDPRLGFTIINS